MITIPDALGTDHVLLDLRAKTSDDAVKQVAVLLQDDPRVTDWKAFYQELRAHVPCRVADAGQFTICLPHARTEAVSELVMSAARVVTPIPFVGAKSPVRYVFCIGAPKTMAADYLRVAGALMRILSDSAAEERLRTAATPQEFLAVLGATEMKL